MKKDLKNMAFQLKWNKWKEKREVVWCTLCMTEGHHKNECPTFVQYLAAGVPNPLPTGGPWCEICKTHRHDPYHCPMMQKYKTVPKSSYCSFFKSVGHDDKDCRTLELMRERTSDTYRMQEEMMTGQDALQFNNVQPQFNLTQPQYNTAQYNQIPQYNAHV
jgi:hypothetical protein